MAASSTGGEHVVLIGAGHAHLHVVSHAARLQRHGASVTLVAPGFTGYSGMASGVLGGRYGISENLIDPGAVARSAGVAYRDDTVIEVDRDRRRVHLARGGALHYDHVSLNIGSVVEAPEAVAGGPRVWPAKPVERLAALRTTLLRELARADSVSVVVVGGGATGSEIAANLTAIVDESGRRPAVAVLEAEERLLSAAPARASAALADLLRRRGVQVRNDTRFEGVDPEGVLTDRGQIPATHVVFATGLSAPPLVERLGVPADRAGGVHVDATLRSPADARIFAVGDCARFLPSPLPRIGVFGVRQAPILLHNLAAAVASRPAAAYRPQRRWLSILDLGDGSGLLLYGRFWFIGRSALWLKRRLDRGFVQGFDAPVQSADQGS